MVEPVLLHALQRPVPERIPGRQRAYFYGYLRPRGLGENRRRGSQKKRQNEPANRHRDVLRSEEHTSELQSRQYLHSFPTRRSSDLLFLWLPQASRIGGKPAPRFPKEAPK